VSVQRAPKIDADVSTQGERLYAAPPARSPDSVYVRDHLVGALGSDKRRGRGASRRAQTLEAPTTKMPSRAPRAGHPVCHRTKAESPRVTRN